MLEHRVKKIEKKFKTATTKYKKTIKIYYTCPGSLYDYFSKKNFKSQMNFEIEEKISNGEIKKYQKNDFWCGSNDNNFLSLTDNKIMNKKQVTTCYAAALYLIDEHNKESFTKKLFEENRQVLSLYNMAKPTSRENLWCYSLPLTKNKDNKYILEIDEKLTTENINWYGFKIDPTETEYINLAAKEIIGTELFERDNSPNECRPGSSFQGGSRKKQFFAERHLRS